MGVFDRQFNRSLLLYFRRNLDNLLHRHDGLIYIYRLFRSSFFRNKILTESERSDSDVKRIGAAGISLRRRNSIRCVRTGSLILFLKFMR